MWQPIIRYVPLQSLLTYVFGWENDDEENKLEINLSLIFSGPDGMN